VRPGREHDTTAARTDPDLLTQVTASVDDGQLGLADLGYEGEADLLRIPIKKPAAAELTADQQAYNAVHGALRCLGERANGLLKTSFKALRRWRGWAPGASATSSPPHSLCCTANTTEQPDPQLSQSVITTLLGKAHRLPHEAPASLGRRRRRTRTSVVAIAARAIPPTTRRSPTLNPARQLLTGSSCVSAQTISAAFSRP
jgi:hypothetical protein